MFHRHALVNQAGDVGVAELVGVDMASADHLGCGPQGILDVDGGHDDGTWVAVIGPYWRQPTPYHRISFSSEYTSDRRCCAHGKPLELYHPPLP